MKKIVLVVLMLLTLGTASARKVKNVIFVIGDGMGLNQVSLLPTPNVFTQADFLGLSITHSASDQVTDSAAGGTALACGVKANNYTLGMDADLVHVNSFMYEAQLHGFSTGIVVSCMLEHATPSAFYAHQVNRKMSQEILSDFYHVGPDVMVAGGSALVSEDSLRNNSYQFVQTLEDLSQLPQGKAVALLCPKEMPKAPERGNAVSDGVSVTLKRLETNKKGFVMMVEGSQIDWAGHGNDAEYLRAEMEDMERVVRTCVDYAHKHKGTLVIVTADHETGGVSLVGEEKKILFSTKQHTSMHVPVYCYGAGAKAFAGTQDNTEFKGKILKLLHLIK